MVLNRKESGIEKQAEARSRCEGSCRDLEELVEGKSVGCDKELRERRVVKGSYRGKSRIGRCRAEGGGRMRDFSKQARSVKVFERWVDGDDKRGRVEKEKK